MKRNLKTKWQLLLFKSITMKKELLILMLGAIVFMSCTKNCDNIKYKECICVYTNCQGDIVGTCNSTEITGQLLEGIFPNPASHVVYVRLKSAGQTVTLKKKNGKVLFQQTIDSNKFLLNISEYPVGKYHLIIDDGMQKTTWCLFKE